MSIFFAKISQEFPPLQKSEIPEIDENEPPMEITGFQIFEKIKKMRIPNSTWRPTTKFGERICSRAVNPFGNHIQKNLRNQHMAGDMEERNCSTHPKDEVPNKLQ